MHELESKGGAEEDARDYVDDDHRERIAQAYLDLGRIASLPRLDVGTVMSAQKTSAVVAARLAELGEQARVLRALRVLVRGAA